MNIKSLEINLLKASEIQDGDVIIVKTSPEEKSKLTKDNVQEIYQNISKMINKKNISIYFFPKNLSVDIIKNHVKVIETRRENIEESLKNNENTDTSLNIK
jgi:hypothetical protein